MIPNLNERFLYQLLPNALLSEDAKGYIEALVSGIQDRVGDLRSYTSKLDQFWVPGGLPDGPVNVVLVDLTSAAGKVYTRSLDLQSDTPSATSNLLPVWAANQLAVDVDTVSNVRYGYDALRAVSADTLSSLAATLGTMLYQTDMLASAGVLSAARQQLVATWFPRLKIKGTAQSFEVLGRILGFDDVRVTPLWTRLSPRVPNDVGDPANDSDFNAAPEYFPQQTIGPFYDPFAYRDGPFYTWTGTVYSGTNSTQFYTEVVNGQNPWVEVIVLGSLSGTNVPAVSNGTVTHPASGSYALANGGAYTAALVECPGSSVAFQALTYGDAFDGLLINVSTSGTLAVLSISDQLSARKYRSSYFDLGLTADMDRIETIFSSRAATVNKDLAANPELTSDGTAASPYRPWVAGSIAVAQTATDWLVDSGTNSSVVVARRAANPASPYRDRQLNMDAVVVAGVQVTQAFEEVRAATRLPRRSQAGFLIDNPVGYAPYTNSAVLFTTGTVSTVYTGSAATSPRPDYVAAISFSYGTVTSVLAAEADPAATDVYHYVSLDPARPVTGTYDFSTGSYAFNTGTFGATVFTAQWTLTTTEVVRPSPPGAVAVTGVEGATGWQFNSQPRPEDEDDSTLVNEVADDYPWLREVTVGGMLVELDSYQSGPAFAVQLYAEETAFPDQTGVDLNVFGITSPNSPHPRSVWQARSIAADYQPGQLPVGYQGTLKSLASLTAAETALIRPSLSASPGDTETDYDTLFQPGYQLFLIGLAQGALVADLNAFFGKHHYSNLEGWLPFNEHVDDTLAVADVSAAASSQMLTGVAYTDRQWDAVRGWCLNLSGNDTVYSGQYRNIEAEISLSFWIKLATVPATETPVVACAPLLFTLNGSGSVAGYVATAYGTNAVIGVADISNGAWSFVYLRTNATVAAFNAATLVSSGTESFGTNAYVPGNPDTDGGPQVTANGAAFAIHDLRVWSEAKTAVAMNRVRYHDPTPTLCTYPLGVVSTLDRQDRYGVRVLPSGWAALDVLPAWQRRTAKALVLNYDSMGSYVGESRYKETGIGDGVQPPGRYQLGQQFITMTAAGTAPFCTDSGNLPGWNPGWQAANYAGTYVSLVNSGSTSVGIVATMLTSGTVSPWPNTMTQSNPFQQYVYVAASSGSALYRLSLDGSTDGTNTDSTWLRADPAGRGRTAAEVNADPYLSVLVASGTVFAFSGTGYVTGTITGATGSYGYYDPTTLTYLAKAFNTADLFISEYPTGPQTLLAASGLVLAADPVAQLGVAIPYAGTNSTPPLYLYTESRIKSQFPQTAVWTGGDNSTTPADNGVDPTANPALLTVDAYGTWLNTPVLGNAGVLEFTDSGTLLPGAYRLTVNSGQLGQADVDFNGFIVSITLNDTVVPARLLQGLGGYSFTGVDTFEFTLNDGVAGGYLLSFDWTNPAADSSRGTQRQLVIYSYTLRRVATEIFSVTVSAGSNPVITALPATYSGTNPTPGGWYATLNGYGSNANFTHESNIYPANDTVVASHSLADTLTGFTNDRMDGVIYNGTSVTVSNTGSFTFPSFGSLTYTVVT